MINNYFCALMSFCLFFLTSFQILAKTKGIAIYDNYIDVSDSRLASKIQISPSMATRRKYSPIQYSSDKIFLYNQFNNLIQISERRPLTALETQTRISLQKQIRIQEFNDFIVHNHGQHVAGIAMAGTVNTHLVAATTKKVESVQRTHQQIMNSMNYEQIDPLFLQEILSQYYGLAEIRQPLYYTVLEEIQKSPLLDLGFLKNEDVAVVNISLGSNLRSDLAWRLADSWSESFRSIPPDQAARMYIHAAQKYVSAHFYSQLMAQRDKLFVLAAGNFTSTVQPVGASADAEEVQEANDNDSDPIFPVSVMTWYKPSNLIVVAATVDRSKLAGFSGYGKKSVHVAAPGVDIASFGQNSTDLSLSGTSQAAPYVSNTAAKMLEANPHLTPLEIKEIILATVDKKDFLTEKVISGGIVNPTRAVRAAELRSSQHIESAIAQALSEVKDL